ncbi:hypothetical protein [uncultured Tenacibaculum sp.]|uniref:hypothetical protein n=1 Tax=uncultured Tenacibaculum sp. TaxID=174713 RepID=UPI002622D576|nr:hypothetical protein [uncultured Tenacibaculum sp.]
MSGNTNTATQNVLEKLSSYNDLHMHHLSGEKNNNPENITMGFCDILNNPDCFNARCIVLYHRTKRRYEGLMFYRKTPFEAEDYENPNGNEELTFLTSKAMKNDSIGDLGKEILSQLNNLTPWQYLNCNLLATTLEHKSDNKFSNDLKKIGEDIGEDLLESTSLQTGIMKEGVKMSKESYAQINYPRINKNN